MERFVFVYQDASDRIVITQSESIQILFLMEPNSKEVVYI